MQFDPRSDFNPYKDSINILKENESSLFESHEIQVILEDSDSPVQMRYNQKIYDAVINKKHIDFDDIPQSKGDIEAYSGTKNMREVLAIIKGMNEFRNSNVIDYVRIVEDAIDNLIALRDIYKKGFASKNDYVMMEYNTFAYMCVEATTSILYEFVDYIKKPGSDGTKIVMKNTKYRANLTYIQQLEKFNNINRNMLSEHRKFLLALIDSGTENFAFTASGVAGLAIIGMIAASIIPITREITYQIVNFQRKLSDCCAQQAYFLEMNKSILEANESLTVEKKKKIIDKQEKIRKQLVVLSEKLRVDHVKANEKAKKELDAENRNITVSNIRRELDDSPLQLL